MIWATFVKELRLFVNDRAALVMTAIMPLVFIAGFGFMFRGTRGSSDQAAGPLPTIPLGIYVPPDAPAAEAVVPWVTTMGLFEVNRVDSAEAVRSGVVAKRWRAGLIFPVDYDGQESLAELSMDLAVSALERTAVEGPLRAAFSRHFGFGLSGRTVDPATLPPPPPFFQPTAPPGLRPAIQRIDSFQISVPGNAVLFCFFLAVGVAMSFHEERKSGAWRRLLAAPGPRGLLLVAKLLPFLFVGTLQILLMFAAGHFLFGMAVGGSVAALVVVSLCVVVAAVSLGLLMASLGGTEKQISAFATLTLLAMGLIGGCMMPRILMPPGLKTAGSFVPHGWALDAYMDILVRDGTGLQDVFPACAALLGFAALFAAVGIGIFRFER